MSLEFPLAERHGVPCPSVHDDQTARVQLSPGLNQIVIPPSQQDALGEAIGVLQYPLVVVSQYVRSGVGCAIGRYKRASAQRLFAVLRGDRARESGMQAVVTLEDAASQLIDEFGPLLRTGTRVLLRELLNSTPVVEEFVDRYAEHNPELDRGAIRRAVERLQSELSSPTPLPSLGSRLADLYAHHGTAVVEAVLDVTFAPPALHPTESDRETGAEPTTRPARVHARTASVDLHERCREAIDAVETIGPSPSMVRSTDKPDGPSLRRRLGAALDGDQQTVADNISRGDDAGLPLLARPGKYAADSGNETLRAVGYPSGLGWLLSRLFEDAGIVAALYRRPEGELDWLVTPFLSTTDASTGLSMAERWERRLFADRILGQLHTRSLEGTGTFAPVECPMCALSVDTCGEESCAFASALSTVNRQLHELVRSIRKTRRTLDDEVDE